MIKFEVVKNCLFPVKLPKRSTKGSAGYDFFSAYPFVIAPGQTSFVKTWVKAQMPKDTVLLLLNALHGDSRNRFQSQTPLE